MSQFNQRKEPTFGEPSATSTDKVESTEKAVEAPKLAFSLSTKTSLGHTFTPVMKRSQPNAELSTLEEQVEQKMTTEQPKNPETVKKDNGGFAFAPVADKAEATAEIKAEPVKVQPQEEPKTEKASSNTIERVIPTAAPAAAKAAVEKVPSKYRRLLIVLLLLLALLLAFFLLKPKTPESVESLQEQGSSLPIEFRPVDEEEAKRAEAQAKAMQEAQAQQQAQQQTQQQVQQPEQTAAQTPATTNEAATTPATEPAQPAVNESVAQNPQPAAQTQEQPVVVAKPAAKPVEHKPVVQEPIKKPSTSGSVIYQPETAAKSTKAAPAPQQPKPAVKAEPVAKPQTKVETPKAAPVVKAEPVKAAESAAPAAVSSKTMTVPKGVSLMQVFRDNHLNISDVNAMSKVNGIVSNLKVGEKVTVRLDKDNRVTEMSIGSGGKFIRQANGSYIYK